MTKPVVFLFAGQGSQIFHMGRELAAQYPQFRQCLLRLDQVARTALGHSVLDIVFDSSRHRFDPFDRLLHSNPALFMVQVALAETLMGLGARPSAVMGASLGEIVALTTAGGIAPDDALRLVIALSQAVERSAPLGGMLAVIAAPAIVELRRELFAGIEIAGFASPGHFIAAGPADRLARAAHVLGVENIACLILPVRYPFHSTLLEPAAAAAGPLLRARMTASLRLPVISCVTASLLDAVADDHLWQVVRAPMRLAEAFSHLEERGESLMVDLSPSGTMATTAKYNLAPGSRTEVLSVMSLFGGEAAGFETVRRRLGV